MELKYIAGIVTAVVVLVITILGLVLGLGLGDSEETKALLGVIGGPDIVVNEDYRRTVEKFMNDTYPVPAGDAKDCTDDNRPGPGEVCRFSPEWLKICSSPKYGVMDAKNEACVFFTFNLPVDVKLEPYTEPQVVPAVPLQLEDEMADLITAAGLPQFLWLVCEGVVTSHFPQAGVPTYYFDRPGEKGYLPPILAVLIKMPAGGVRTKCSIFTKNLEALKARGATEITVSVTY